MEEDTLVREIDIISIHDSDSEFDFENDENFKASSRKRTLFYGRNGSGKTTLINLILLSTMMTSTDYESRNSNVTSSQLEVVDEVCKTMLTNNGNARNSSSSITSMRCYATRIIDALLGNGKKIENIFPLDFVDVKSYANADGKWADDNQYKDEIAKIEKYYNQNYDSVIEPVHPYLLQSPGRGNKSVCTKHRASVQFGCRWQAVITFFTLSEILDMIVEGNPEENDLGIYLDEICKIVIVENESKMDWESNVEENFNIFSTSSSSLSSSAKSNSSESRYTKEGIEKNIPKEVNDFLISHRGQVIVTNGKDMDTDRMIIRSEVLAAIKKYDSIIKDITIFAPSHLLEENSIILVDAPGGDDADWRNKMHLNRASKEVDLLVVVSMRGIKAGFSQDEFSSMFANRVIINKENESPLPIYIFLREELEEKLNLDDLKLLKPGRREEEKLKTLASFKQAIIKKNKDVRLLLDNWVEDMQIYGGYFFYIWCAMRALGKTIEDKSSKEYLLEESGYNDLIQFLSSNKESKSLALRLYPAPLLTMRSSSLDNDENEYERRHT